MRLAENSIATKNRADEVFDLVSLARTIKGGRLEQMIRESEKKAVARKQKLDLPRMVELLAKHRVEFVVIGGYAVAFHGAPRFTRDLDILYRTTEQNVDRLLAALRESGLPLKIAREDLLNKTTNYKVGFPPDQLDLSAEDAFKGIRWEEAWKTAVEGELAGAKVRFLGLEQLITAKRAAGRTQDEADVERLLHRLGEW